MTPSCSSRRCGPPKTTASPNAWAICIWLIWLIGQIGQIRQIGQIGPGEKCAPHQRKR
jgi:hypothetical protein